MPKIMDIVHRIAQFKFVAKIDLLKAFHYSPLPIEEQPYYCFRHPISQQTFSYTTLPMGAVNSSELFYRHLQFVLDKLPANLRSHIVHYIGGVIIFHDEMHVVHDIIIEIKKVLEQAKLPINYSKSDLNPRTSKMILGYTWNAESVTAEENKINSESCGKNLRLTEMRRNYRV
eukprot:GHVP01025962.1.p1 GENE.GHVP01025962.1~~GHVP01025962.1.p1  ORF type:complete len:173 (+),score=11.79 GHVP01025962.1:178-696(+)